MKKPTIKDTTPPKKMTSSDATVYRRTYPEKGLESIVSCFWMIENREDASRKVQKVVPDGYPEIIFHFADPYMIRLQSDWELQPLKLVAGQIKRHFFLGNTGRSSMIGIKMMPTTFTHLFGVNMDTLTGKVLNLKEVAGSIFNELYDELNNTDSFDERCNLLNLFFDKLLSERPLVPTKADEAVSLIFSSNGTVTVRELCNALSIGERQLERLFRQYVGLSPKFYSRIIRFSQIFQHIEKGDPFWTDTVYRTGFYDQSHFIKNFKAFTGEEPSEYLFEELNIANFFLNK